MFDSSLRNKRSWVVLFSFTILASAYSEEPHSAQVVHGKGACFTGLSPLSKQGVWRSTSASACCTTLRRHTPALQMSLKNSDQNRIFGTPSTKQDRGFPPDTHSSIADAFGSWCRLLLPVVSVVIMFGFHMPIVAEPALPVLDGVVAAALQGQEHDAQSDLVASADPQYDRLVDKMRESSHSETTGRRSTGSVSECVASNQECTPGYGTKRTAESIRRDINKNLLLQAWDTIHRGGYGYPGWYDPNGGLFVPPDSFMGSERAAWVSDPSVLNSRTKTHDAIRRMVEDLHDPYSRFLTKEEAVLEHNVPSQLAAAGRTVGVGLALFDPLDGKEDLVVVAPVPESPAELAGIKPLDRVSELDGLDVGAVHLTPDEAMSLLRGPQDSEVELRVADARNAVGTVDEGKDALGDRLPRQMRAWAEPDELQRAAKGGPGSQDAVQTVKLKRRNLTIPPVRAGVIDSPFVVDSETNGGTRTLKYGYIRINYFNLLGTDMVASALAQLEQEHVDGIILDLRNCLGGLFKEALYSAAMLLGEEEDATLVRTMDSSGFVKRLTVAQQRDAERWPDKKGFPLARPLDSLRSKPLRIITNRGSASSSEVLAMALVGNGRGSLLGERTFGKALIQHPYTLSDGSVIKLTVAEYLSPRGQHLGRGLEPDALCPASPAPKAADQCARMAQGDMARQGRAKAVRLVGQPRLDPGLQPKEGGTNDREPASASRLAKRVSSEGLRQRDEREKEGERAWWLWERSAVSAVECGERFEPLDLRRGGAKPRP